MPAQSTKNSALKTLDIMAQLVKNERLIHGVYITNIADPNKSKAICQGHRMCAVGSLWWASGVRRTSAGELLPGVVDDAREDFLKNRPSLRLAYEALNAASAAYAKRHFGIDDMDGYAGEEGYSGELENLFEVVFKDEFDAYSGATATDDERKAMLAVIKAAKARVRNA